MYPANGINICGHTLHFNLNAHQSQQTNTVNIDSIIAIIDTTIIVADSNIKNSTNFDSVFISTQIPYKQQITKIEYPAGDTTVLYHFFTKLNTSHNKRVRVLHYGDSQIEGDRITGYLRNKFQKKFGGGGPGLLPACTPPAESASIKHTISDNWEQLAVFVNDTITKNGKYGALGSYARFSKKSNNTTANIKFSQRPTAFGTAKKFTVCRVFLGQSITPISLAGYQNNKLDWFETDIYSTKTQVLEWNLLSPPNNIELVFNGNLSPNVYGIALDSKNGVAVDNIPLRGSSGTEFTKIDLNNFKQMAKYLNTGLIILQFGVNIVPHKTTNYKYYEQIITRQIKHIKKAMPNTPVLVIGVSDMSEKNGNQYISHSNITGILQAQKNAAQNTGAAFWNLYQAMGGQNSMPAWVLAKPPLAQKDFVHFNRKGGHIIAQMLFDALLFEYDKYNTTTQLAHK